MHSLSSSSLSPKTHRRHFFFLDFFADSYDGATTVSDLFFFVFSRSKEKAKNHRTRRDGSDGLFLPHAEIPHTNIGAPKLTQRNHPPWCSSVTFHTKTQPATKGSDTRSSKTHSHSRIAKGQTTHETPLINLARRRLRRPSRSSPPPRNRSGGDPRPAKNPKPNRTWGRVRTRQLFRRD